MTTTKQRRDGSGSVYQRADGQWVAQVRVWDEFTGTSKKVRRYAPSRDEARRLLTKMRDGDTAPTRGTSDGLTIAAYLENWKDTTLPRRGIAESTQDTYRRLIVSPIAPTIGQTRLAAFTPAEAERWLARLDQHRTKPRRDKATKKLVPGPYISQATKRQAYTVLSLALDTAVRDGLIAENPLAKVPRPRKAATEVPVWTAEEVDATVTAAAGTDIEALVIFVANTGCRVGEALALRWSEVDLDRATATLLRSGTDSDRTKTAAGRRAVPLLPDVVDALRRERAVQAANRLRLGAGWADHDLVFPSRVGTPLDPHNARRMLRQVLKEAGVPASRPWHTMRHSLATRLLNRGVAMPVVAAILGHASIRTTVDLYGHTEPAINAAALAEAMAR